MFRSAITFLFTFLMVQVAYGGDSVKTNGKLSNADFYRLVSCGAKPGGDCRAAPLRYSRGTVDVALFKARGAKLNKAHMDRIARAVSNAIAEINQADARIKYRLVRGGRAQRAEVKLYMVNADKGDRIRGTGFPLLDGQKMQRAITVMLPFGRNRILTSGIAISNNLRADHVQSIVLEELYQALGLRFDVDNPYYEGRSIVAEFGNKVTRLSGQDQWALRQHYR